MAKTRLDLNEIEKLEQSASNVRDRLLVRLLSRLGCQVSELLALQEKNIDTKAKTVTIQHLKSSIKLACPKCNARLSRSNSFCPGCGVKIENALRKEVKQQCTRVLPIDQDTMEMLKDYIQRGGSVKQDGNKLLFGIERRRAWQIVRECARKAGLPNITNPETRKEHGVSPQRLRDAFANRAIKLNDSSGGLRLLQEHLGHKSIVSTTKYRKKRRANKKAWYDKLSAKKEKTGGTKAE